MTESAATRLAHEKLPPLARDRGFWGMTATQLLGAFNDNLFKQVILLLCVDYANRHPGSIDQQGTAQALFALPFVLFSGFGGYLSDRFSKRTIVVLCKLAEIGVMLAGFAALLTGGLWPLFIVLFFMGTQSAFFGPSKYGILPEMLRERDLPAGNGMIQMTTFLAIIFGTAAAGYGKELVGDELWLITAACVAIAVAGTFTSLLVRPTPVAQAQLQFALSSLAMSAETRQMLRNDRPLLLVLLISSLFWFVGGLVLPGVNALGKLEAEMDLKDARTSLLAACMGVGIAVGCVAAGKLSRNRLRFEFVTAGAWGMVVCLAAVTLVGTVMDVPEQATSNHAAQNRNPVSLEKPGFSAPPAEALESLDELLIPKTTQEAFLRAVLTALGISAGLFVVPLQVFMQARPPKDQKGRMIGAMNLINWVGILLAAGFYQLCAVVLEGLGMSIGWIFAVTSLLLLPVALFYRPREERLA